MILLSALFALTLDTIPVTHARVEGPYPIVSTYVTDSLSMAGKGLDLKEALDRNKSLASRNDRFDPAAAAALAKCPVLKRGDALTVGADSLPALRLIRFDVEASAYAKAKVSVDRLANYKLFADGREVTDATLKLTPGRTEVALMALTQRADRDSFLVSLTGDSLSAIVTVNPSGKRPFTMADMTQGPHYRSATISPSGRYLVTVSYFMRPDGTAQYETVLTEVASGKELLCRHEYLALSWAEGAADRLYYTRNGARGRELVVFTPETGHEELLADDMPEGYFNVSPREDYLIFSLSDEGKKPAGSLKRLEEPDDRMPGWRDRGALWRYDLRTKVMQRLTFGKAGVGLCDISADGRSLLLRYNRFDTHRAPFDRTTLVRMDAYTGHTDTLLCDTAFVSSAKFSPDGRQLLIKASPGAFGGVGLEVKEGQVPNAFDYRLYRYDIASRTVTPLLPHFAPSVESYDWASGDGRIYFTATDGSGVSLFSLNPAKAGDVTRYALPVSTIQGHSVALGMKHPTAVFFGQTGERARELFTASLTSDKPKVRRIGNIDFDKLFADVAIGTCHDWRFKATRGDSIDGYYFLPPDFDATKHYPLIVYYYGGCVPTPKMLEFQYPLQVLAGQGYVVYVVNPSGAIGYGQEFAARHVNTWGKESGDDIIEGTKHFLASHPYIDPARVGCMGASYGGFMTEYLQTRTDIFACAISHAGISNIASYWGGGYWGYSYGECAQYGSYPWNNRDLYVNQSPLFNADKIHTPLLLLHGTADTNVPTTESQQLFTALKILGREVAYVTIDGENHVITDYSKRMEWQEAIFAWFAKYLKCDSRWWNALGL